MATYWENSCSFGLRYVSWYKYLIVSLVFSHLGFWNGNLFLIAPFPDLCLLVPFDPSMGSCETSQVPLASEPDSFLGVLQFSPHLLIGPSHLRLNNLKSDVNLNKIVLK